MAYLDADTLLVKASTTSGGTYATIKGVTSFDDGADTSDTEIPVFAETDPLTFTRKNARTFDGAGVRDPADTTGQNIIAAGYESGDVIYVQVLPDGTTGYRYPVRVTAWGEQRSADDNAQRYTFSLKQTGARVAVP